MNEIKCSSIGPDKRVKFIQKNIVYVDEDVMSTRYDDLCIPVRIKMPSELEYIFQLISCHFSYVKIEEIIMPDSHGNQEPKLAVKILHIPRENTELDISYWNNFAESIKTDFYARCNLNEWNIDHDALRDKVQECWTDFKIVDRNKLDVDKLTNLILFVFDYCKLTLTKAKLHPQLYDYIEKTVKLGKETYSTSKRIADSIMEYLAEPYICEFGLRLLKDTLPEVSYPIYEQNPYAGNKSSYLAMMFIDNMHSFFSSFGIKRIKNSEWSKAEKNLMYEMLKFFGVCKSELSANDSRYIKSVVDKYNDYFDKCNLYSWLRHDQEYSYLINISDIDWNEHGSDTEL